MVKTEIKEKLIDDIISLGLYYRTFTPTEKDLRKLDIEGLYKVRSVVIDNLINEGKYKIEKRT